MYPCTLRKNLMTYFKLQSDGSTLTPLGQIVGYRVLYTDKNGKPKTMTTRNAAGKPTTIFSLWFKANNAAKALRMGQVSRIVPVYSGDK